MTMTKKEKTNYRVTIGYKAVISVEVFASNENEAKQKALDDFQKQRDSMYKKNVILEDDSYGAYGITDQDKTWNQL